MFLTIQGISINLKRVDAYYPQGNDLYVETQTRVYKFNYKTDDLAVLASNLIKKHLCGCGGNYLGKID